LLVLPELFLTGYELPGITADPDQRTTAADPRLDPLREACAAHRTALVVGAPTRTEDGTLHISALVLDRDGNVAATYDKQHATPIERAAGFAPGGQGTTFVLDGWRLGLSVCWDSSFPEHARAAALDGCHAYLNGGMFSPAFSAKANGFMFPTRAMDNTSYALLAKLRAERPLRRGRPQRDLGPARRAARRRRRGRSGPGRRRVRPADAAGRARRGTRAGGPEPHGARPAPNCRWRPLGW
jgi:predicted amidohydrolase